MLCYNSVPKCYSFNIRQEISSPNTKKNIKRVAPWTSHGKCSRIHHIPFHHLFFNLYVPFYRRGHQLITGW